MPAFFSLIPAAGVGSRMAGVHPKQYMRICDKPVLRHVLDTFAATPEISHTFVAVSPTDSMIDTLIGDMPPALADAGFSVLRIGGATRNDTVRSGLAAIAGLVDKNDWILVHDAARPGLTVSMIQQLIAALKDDAVGGLLALPIVDTIKRAGRDGRSLGSVERDGLWLAQTPQMFRYQVLCDALAQTAEFTDEASAVEAFGLQPKLVAGSARNFKLTLPGDIALAGLYLKND